LWRPLRLGHYWVQALFSAHAVAVYDISDLSNMREVSCLTFDDKQKPHWMAQDETEHRIVMNSGEYGEHRVSMVNFDPQTGKLTLDEKFRDPGNDRRESVWTANRGRTVFRGTRIRTEPFFRGQAWPRNSPPGAN
jgi:hypothetical protein